MVGEKLRMILNGVAILENKRPDWLVSSQGERLELDFYIPELDIAIEVQGKQHYTFVPHFHLSRNGFSEQLRRDREKRYLCDRKGITLLEVASDTEIDDMIDTINGSALRVETDEEFAQNLRGYKHKNKKHLAKLHKIVEIINSLERKVESIRSQLIDHRIKFEAKQEMDQDLHKLIEVKQRKLSNIQATLIDQKVAFRKLVIKYG